jgi:hypothetical protein
LGFVIGFSFGFVDEAVLTLLLTDLAAVDVFLNFPSSPKTSG